MLLPRRSKKIYLPPLHIMLGLIKISVKAMDKLSGGVAYFRQKFPQIIKTRNEFSLVHKLHIYTKTNILIHNNILQKEEPKRHFKTSAELSRQ